MNDHHYTEIGDLMISEGDCMLCKSSQETHCWKEVSLKLPKNVNRDFLISNKSTLSLTLRLIPKNIGKKNRDQSQKLRSK